MSADRIKEWHKKSTQADNKTNSIYMQMHHFRFVSANLQIYIILARIQIEERTLKSRNTKKLKKSY